MQIKIVLILLLTVFKRLLSLYSASFLSFYRAYWIEPFLSPSLYTVEYLQSSKSHHHQRKPCIYRILIPLLYLHSVSKFTNIWFAPTDLPIPRSPFLLRFVNRDWIDPAPIQTRPDQSILPWNAPAGDGTIFILERKEIGRRCLDLLTGMTNSVTMLHPPMVSGPNNGTSWAIISFRRFSVNSLLLVHSLGIAGRFCIGFSDWMDLIFYGKTSVNVVLCICYHLLSDVLVSSPRLGLTSSLRHIMIRLDTYYDSLVPIGAIIFNTVSMKEHGRNGLMKLWTNLLTGHFLVALAKL